MITVKDAYLRAKKEFADFALIECVDIGNRFAFYFSPGEKIPGIPYVTVEKTSGEVDFLSIPPLENLKLIRKGKRITIETFN